MEEAVNLENVEQTVEIIQNTELLTLLKGVVLLVVCLIASKLILRLLDQTLKRATAISPTLHTFIRTTVRWVLYFISVVVAADSIGIPISSFVALFSIAGIALSLAVQGLLSNLAGGLIILGSKPFQLGDYIETDMGSGTVKDIGFLHTQLAAIDGKRIYLPNGTLYNTRVNNCSSVQARRVDLSVSASYDNAPEEVRAAVMDAVAETPEVLSDPAPKVVLEAYEDSAIRYSIWVWVRPSDFFTVKYNLNERLYEAFRRNDVMMTYPHINVHMDDK